MLTIAAQLTAARAKRGVTQQAVADFVGVSKASVSKWETGQSYPDITLLPLLAAYFDLSVDQLIGYRASLTQAETAQLYRRMQAEFATESAAAMQAAIDDVTHRYYACPAVLIAMGSLTLNHYDRLPGADVAAKLATHIPAAQALFDRAAALTQDAVELDKATKLSATCDLMLRRPDAILAKLGTTTPEAIPAAVFIAWAHQLKQDLPAATATLQSSLYQDVIVLLSELTNYLALLPVGDVKRAATYDRGTALIDAFEVASLNPLAAINFWAAAAVGFAQNGDAAAAESALARLVPVLRAAPAVLELHGDDYFDAVGPWLDATDAAGATPRNAAHWRQEIAQQLLATPGLAQGKWVAALQSIKEENHE